MAEKKSNPYLDLKYDRFRVFVDEYVFGSKFGKLFNKTKAAEAAGYTSGAAVQGNRLYGRDDIRAAIQYMMSKHHMPKEEVISRFNAIARAEVGDLITLDAHGNLKLDAARFELLKPYLKSFSYDANGNPKLEFHDSFDALKSLARAYGMNKEGVELSGPGGAAVPVEMQLVFVDPENPLPENPDGVVEDYGSDDEDYDEDAD